MKSRNGFTLVELLAVVAIMAILVIIAVPNIIKVYNSGVLKEMLVQENNIKDAANLYLEDHCNSKLDEDSVCPSSYEYANYNDEKFVCLSDLQAANDNYINDVKFKSDTCQGVIVYDRDRETGLYTDAKTYLYCGNGDTGEYNYVTDEDLNPGRYARCNIKVNNDIYYIQLMQEQLFQTHSILQREYELVYQGANDTNTIADREAINKELKQLNAEINKIYDFNYLDAYLFHENNDLTGKYVVRDASTSGLKLNNVGSGTTVEEFENYKGIVNDAIKTVRYFRSYLGAEQNAYEYRQNFKKCGNDKNCRLGVVNDMVSRIYELSYRVGYGITYSDFDRIVIDLEVQALFKNFNTFAETMGDNSVSKDAIFPNGKNTLTMANGVKVYEDANKYLKAKGTKRDLSGTSTWLDEVSMYQTATGAIDEVFQIVQRQNELITQCGNDTNTASDRAAINNELGQLIAEIDRIKDQTAFNEIGILKDKGFYSEYLLYDISDENLKKIDCNSPVASDKIIKDYMKKVVLNLSSLGANMNKAEYLDSFTDCFGDGCSAKIVKNILSVMIERANMSMNETNTDDDRESLNLEYTAYFKALDHIAIISENSSYSSTSLGLRNTNILTSESASAAKTLLSSKISSIK